MARLYICGPMSAHADDGYNYAAFREAARLWRSFGWDVFDPSERYGGRTDLPYELYLKESVIDVTRCDAIARLPGWQKSNGARVEVYIARALSYPIYDSRCPVQSGSGGRKDSLGGDTHS